MIALGAGEVCVSIFNGHLEDKVGLKWMVIVNIIEMLLAFLFIIAYTEHGEFTYSFATIMNFFWGV